MSDLTIGVIVTAAIVVFGAVVVVSSYNRLVNLNQRVLNAFAQIDVQLKRRHGLIPNLVEAVRGYMVYEQQTLERVIQARGAAMSALQGIDLRNPAAVNSLAGAENDLIGALGQLKAIREAYPNLKADQNASRLMEELSSAENRVAFARQAYNDAVTAYNSTRLRFPNILLAGLFGFGVAQLFQIDQAAERELVKVQL